MGLLNIPRFWGGGGRIKATPVVAVIEPDDGPWINNVNWGNQFKGQMPATAGEVRTVLKTGPLPGPPRLHTVQLFRDDTRSAQNADVRAKISYGVGGVNNSFLCDWVAGAQFGLVASDLQVDAVSMQPSLITPYDPSTAEIILSATVGSGGVGHGPPIVLSEASQNLAAAASVDFDVPDFARAFTVRGIDTALGAGVDRTNSNPAFLTNVSASAFTVGAQILYFVDLQIFAGAAGAHGVPIPAGTSKIRILNQSANPWRISLSWMLSL